MIYQIEIELNDLVDNIKFLLGKELTLIDNRNGRAAWIAGNCLIEARRVTEWLSEFELVNALKFPFSANKQAMEKWDLFKDKLGRNVGEVRLVQDYSRVAEKTLAVMELLEKPEEREELKRLSTLQPEEMKKLLWQAGEEYLGLKSSEIEEHSKPPVSVVEEQPKPSEKSLDDKGKFYDAVIEWVSRYDDKKIPSRMEDFLYYYNDKNKTWLTKEILKNGLVEAGQRGEIIKLHRRWHRKTDT